METITKSFKEEKDFLYRKGAERERAKTEAKILAEKLKSAKRMKESGFNNKLIADILELPLEQIEKL